MGNISEIQLAANRKNCLHSSGPKTISDKLRVSKNSTRHGLFSKQLILQNEDKEHYQAMLDKMVEDHKPSSTIERFLVVLHSADA